jgi:hypothetical protein
MHLHKNYYTMTASSTSSQVLDAVKQGGMACLALTATMFPKPLKGDAKLPRTLCICHKRPEGIQVRNDVPLLGVPTASSTA